MAGLELLDPSGFGNRVGYLATPPPAIPATVSVGVSDAPIQSSVFDTGLSMHSVAPRLERGVVAPPGGWVDQQAQRGGSNGPSFIP
jgi:hypothetical protein